MNSRLGRYLRFLIACFALTIALPAQASTSIGARDPIVLVAETLRQEAGEEVCAKDEASDEQPRRATQSTPSVATAYEAPDRARVTRKYLRHCALLC